MASELPKIIAQLGSLSSSELKSVRMAIDHLSGGAPGEEVSTEEPSLDDEGEHWHLFYEQSKRILEDKGLPCPPWYAFRKMNIYRHFKKKLPEIEAYTTKYFKNLNRRDRQRLYRIYAELLMDWMENNPMIPLKIGVFFQNLNQIPSLVARAFPGYSEVGWLPLILQMGSRTHGVPKNE